MKKHYFNNEGYICCLIEQVKGLEADNYNMNVELEKLYKQNKRYYEILEQDSRQEVIESLYEDNELLKQEVKELEEANKKELCDCFRFEV